MGSSGRTARSLSGQGRLTLTPSLRCKQGGQYPRVSVNTLQRRGYLVVGDSDELEVALLGTIADYLRQGLRKPNLFQGDRPPEQKMAKKISTAHAVIVYTPARPSTDQKKLAVTALSSPRVSCISLLVSWPLPRERISFSSCGSVASYGYSQKHVIGSYWLQHSFQVQEGLPCAGGQSRTLFLWSRLVVGSSRARIPQLMQNVSANASRMTTLAFHHEPARQVDMTKLARCGPAGCSREGVAEGYVSDASTRLTA